MKETNTIHKFLDGKIGIEAMVLMNIFVITTTFLRYNFDFSQKYNGCHDLMQKAEF